MAEEPKPVQAVVGAFPKPPSEMTDEEIDAWANEAFDALASAGDDEAVPPAD